MKTLQERALLVSLHRSTFSGTVTDVQGTELVAKATNVRRKGNYRKRLFSESLTFQRLTESFRELYDYHTAHTLPWEDRGPRLLPADAYFEFTNEVRTRRNRCDSALQAFLADYPASIVKDQQVLGSLFNVDDYPDPAAMAGRWAHEVVFQPIPATSDFRISVDADVKAQLENHLTDRVEQAKAHIVQSLLEPLQVAVERLSKTPGEAGSIFRDSLVENIVDTAQRMGSLVGLTDDPALHDLVSKARALADTLPAPEALRHNVGERQRVATTSAALVEDIVNLFG